jgi:hypothetical protein
MRKGLLSILLIAVVSHGARAETLYVSWIDYGNEGATVLSRFESDTPWLIDELVPAPALPPGSLDFDLSSGQLWSFDHYQ